METVTVGLGERAYDILIGNSTLPDLGTRCKALGLGTRVAIVTNPTVGAHYLAPTRNALADAGFDVSVCELPDGERYKNTDSINTIYDHLVDRRLDRGSFLVALGGGVIGDMTGFAAATFLRGIPFVQVPTTVVAQVDSSVGGKTGVNHPRGKNLIGAFHQPRLVLMDLDMLGTLPHRELLAGIAEVVKYGVIEDADFFDFLNANAKPLLALEPGVTARVVRRCCELKAQVVADDERETSGRRAILNYGHTVGHAIEAVTGYKEYLHGEAVGLGMVAAARIAHRLGRLAEAESEAQRALLERFGLPTEIPQHLDRAAIADAMGLDKKVASGKIRLILADRIGHVEMVPFSADEVRTLVKDL
ncbi:MAG: 3-dehydroquinate synthase [Nitrospirota bacterium]|nr:3-dehydroquinate synthase [Nitrospirota bacterium]